MKMTRWIRQCRKAFRFSTVLTRAAITCSAHKSWSNADREHWLHLYAPQALKAFGVRVQVHGTVPVSGLIVSNHLSYLDILTLSSVLPCSFVSKDDVDRWPFVGWLCRVAGTIFIDRRSRLDTYRVNDLVGERLKSGSPVVVFPEGTSSDGSTVLPFHSSLLQPAINVKVPITPLCISYQVEDGDAASEVCYWGKMVFLPHLWHMLGTRRIEATVQIGEAQLFSDRKTAAFESRRAILALSGNCAGPTGE
jgi:1-acyl-sn-glycerol-3-phosphate acyltransferase